MLRYKYFLFILFFVSALFTSCRKDKTHTQVEGRVVDATTNSGVPNATVFLMRRNTDCFSCNAGTWKSYITDAGGNFNFDFDAEDNYAYSLAGEANNYFSSISTGGVTIETGRENNMRVAIEPKAWVKFHVENINPYDIYDQISFWGPSSMRFYLYGTNIDTIYVPMFCQGNRNLTVYWSVIKNSIQTNYSGSVFCPAFDTTLYQINY